MFLFWKITFYWNVILYDCIQKCQKQMRRKREKLNFLERRQLLVDSKKVWKQITCTNKLMKQSKSILQITNTIVNRIVSHPTTSAFIINWDSVKVLVHFQKMDWRSRSRCWKLTQRKKLLPLKSHTLMSQNQVQHWLIQAAYGLAYTSNSDKKATANVLSEHIPKVLAKEAEKYTSF